MSPYREIRASFAEETITVYQAYPEVIAGAALRAGTFVAPFKRDRMTWIKPSFLWMAYRCGWASKAGQERVLAVELTQEGFEWALAHAALSHFEADVHGSTEAWEAERDAAPVRVQWDPERDLLHRPLAHRSIQVGIAGVAVGRYVDEWIVGLTDVTDRMVSIGDRVRTGDLDAATALLPSERPYPLPEALVRRLGATPEEV